MRENNPTDKKEVAKKARLIKKCIKTTTVIQERMKGLNDLLTSIGGIITDEEAKTMMLQKHNILV